MVRGHEVPAMTASEKLRAQDSFEDEQFEGLDLTQFDFSGKEFVRCAFRNAKLQESRWSKVRLEDCAFEECDLTRMVPGDLRAYGVRFKGCKLMGVEWTRATLHPQLAFEDCNLRYASFVELSLRGTPFVRCKAMEANFVDVDLTEADFTGADLSGASFQGATLARADLSTASGAFLDPAKNRVKDAKISVDTAVLLAAFHGLRVAGYHDDPPRSSGRGRRNT
jgi:uncharacterized protein YjbI with pentapeptide repeats